ncbi:alpha/beta fold hydrolase [Streptosporangium saharense]|uniref:Pimeloyl-ACP methyl ester carboxylesterase n=1 Tax=Streptosporangium saharense TaxID=1706840 RepID=A0A7W7QWR2_9ACTN|nr:alpha/beta hydrolase [Streptosporangium saharense]MBB4921004.1 pimeloyl-ACP methyl ester carboxylesterase [Streptosporangium saharense]
MMIDSVEAAGARLHVERAGDGPALLLISGGGGDAAMYADVVPLLTRTFTVITYDRRGNSRSPFTHPEASITPATQADDAVAILDHYGLERAYLFGNSGGAAIALEIVARHPNRLLGAVVHEPPLVQLLPADAPERREIEHIGRLGQDGHLMRAYAAFGAMTLPDPPRMFLSPAGQAVIAAGAHLMLAADGLARKIDRREPDAMTRQLHNAELMLRRELPAFCFDYQPDLTVLAATTAPWCLATGRDSVGKPYYTPAHLLSELLGIPCQEFPGGHVPFMQHPAEFTKTLTTILEGFAA